MIDTNKDTVTILEQMDSTLASVYKNLRTVYTIHGINATFSEYENVVRQAFLLGYATGVSDGRKTLISATS